MFLDTRFIIWFIVLPKKKGRIFGISPQDVSCHIKEDVRKFTTGHHLGLECYETADPSGADRVLGGENGGGTGEEKVLYYYYIVLYFGVKGGINVGGDWFNYLDSF